MVVNVQTITLEGTTIEIPSVLDNLFVIDSSCNPSIKLKYLKESTA